MDSKNPGFSLVTATIFIVGEVAGGGILGLPHAVSQASWTGLLMIVFCAFCAGFSGLYLAKCWLILEDRYPSYRKGLTRKPFATIGYHAFGPWMSVFVSIIMNVTRIGATTVFILLTSNLIILLTKSFIDWNVCRWAPIVALIILIPMFFGSPIDFWPTAYAAMISTTLGSFILLACIIRAIVVNGFRNNYSLEGFTSLASSFGTILFAFGGASAFPNFQNDMRDKRQFPKAVIFGFVALLMLYLPTAGLGYALFSSDTQFNIIDNFQDGSDKTIQIMINLVQICFLIHCLTVVLIVINPVFLDLEELLRVPKLFNWKRIILRTSILILATFLAETFPNFGQILDLIGGSTITLMAFILPPLFYMKLCFDPEWKDQRNCPLFLRIIFMLIIFSGLLGGMASTYSTLKSWSPLESACYIASKNHNQTGGG